MHQLRFTGFRVAVAGLHAAGLEVAAVGAGGNLAVLVLARHPDFEVVGLHGAEAHITGAQRQLAVRQLEQLQHALGVGGQAFQRCKRLAWLDDLHHLDLVELVLTDHAARVTARGAGFAAETWGVRHQLHWQLLRVKNFAGNDIGQRHFSGRDQVQIRLAFTADLEQVFLELRQLASALQRRRLHQVRRIGFFVAVLGGVQVDHELRQRAVHAGDGATQQGKARAGELGGGFKVQPAMLLAQGDVILNREIKAAWRAPARYLNVALFIGPYRHRLVRQVGDVQHQVVQLDLDAFQLTFAFFQVAAHAIDFGEQRRDVFATLLGLANGLGAGIALGLQLFGAGLHALALRLKGFETHHVELEAAAGKAFRYFVELRTYEFGVEHGGGPKKSELNAPTRAQCRAVYGFCAGKPSVLSVTGVPGTSPARPPAGRPLRCLTGNQQPRRTGQPPADATLPG